MGVLTRLLFIGISFGSAYFSYQIFRDHELPKIAKDQYWGPSSTKAQKEDTSIKAFNVNIDEKVLSDLKNRLKLELTTGNRLTKPYEGIGFEYGFNTDYLKTVGQHWLDKYDWKQREKLINKYPHFMTKISGIDIHFQHVKSSNNKKYKTTRPLILVHGWPGSFIEFQKIIPLLTDPKDSDMNFELVIPSLPGYGFSEGAAHPGLGTTEIGQVFIKLMQRLGLGHNNFYAQGGDLGSFIVSSMATTTAERSAYSYVVGELPLISVESTTAILYHFVSANYLAGEIGSKQTCIDGRATTNPQNVLGIHQNLCSTQHNKYYLRRFVASFYPQLFMSAEEVEEYYPFSKYFGLILRESGYSHIQMTKPDTLGVGLSNSPLGLASYIIEKFSVWTDIKQISKQDGGLTSMHNLDELLDNIMIYWATNSITTSFRLYAETFSPTTTNLLRVPVKVPTACFAPKNEFLDTPEFFLHDKYPQLVRYTRGSKGGHFTAIEIPEILAKDILQSFNQIEESSLTQFKKKEL